MKRFAILVRRSLGPLTAAVCMSLVALSPLSSPNAGATSPGSAKTSNGLTIEVSTVKLHARVLVTLTVQVVCASVSGTFELDQVTANVLQANGHHISSASGSFQAGSVYGGNAFLICDGSTVNRFAFRMLPDSGSGPFNPGPAILTVTAQHDMSGGSDNGNIGPKTTELVAAN